MTMARLDTAPLEAGAPHIAAPLLEFRNVQVVYDNAIEAVRDVSWSST